MPLRASSAAATLRSPRPSPRSSRGHPRGPEHPASLRDAPLEQPVGSCQPNPEWSPAGLRDTSTAGCWPRSPPAAQPPSPQEARGEEGPAEAERREEQPPQVLPPLAARQEPEALLGEPPVRAGRHVAAEPLVRPEWGCSVPLPLAALPEEEPPL